MENKIVLSSDIEFQDIERKVRGKFNKDLLLNSFFEHTELFSPAANNFLKTGKYSGEIFNSKKYNIFWQKERERCLDGYENPKTKVWIPGKYYFFLNYKQMKIIPEDQKHLKKAKRITAFPRFWPIHYHFSLDYKLGIENGLNMAVLKPRDTGFSELLSAFGVHEYTFQTEDPVFFFTGVERYLIKDGILSKSWDQLEFLNEHTERAFKHLRQKIDQNLIKRASYIDPETRTERKTGGEIHGAVVDHPRKLRGARGFVNFEEGGSFPDVESAWMTAKALAEQGGVKFSHMLIWGCVCAGTKVWTHDGRYINIEDLQQEDGIIGYNGKGISHEPIVGLNPPREKPCYRIELENGLSLECSEDHPLLWSNEQLRPHGKKHPRKIKFIRADQVSPGDQIMVINEVPIFGTETMRDARFVGLAIGDGNYNSNSSVSICGCDIEVLEFIESNYSHRENIEKINKSDQRVFKDYTIHGMIPYFKELGIYGQTKQEKRLPINLHTYNKESIAELLGGYFDADSSVRNDLKRGVSIILTSISYELLQQVKELLIKFGVHCTILEEHPLGGFEDKKYERHLVYRLYINRHSSVLNFQKNIKLLCRHKQDKIDSVVTKNKKLVKNVDNAEFIFDKATGKGAYFINKKDLGGMQAYKVLSIEYIGYKPIYNLNAGTTHTYLANNIITANTGGEQGDGIAGLDNIFNKPDAFECLEFDNCWMDGAGYQPHGFFFPVWANMTKFMDKWGNTDHQKAKAFWDEQREKTRAAGSNMLLDKLIAEYPYTPMEALMRLQSNPFPVERLTRQLMLVESSPDIRGMLKVGRLEVDEKEVKFKLDNSLDPILKYPHKANEVIEGAFTILEAPLKDETGKVPANLYYIVADCFAVDTEQATEFDSLGTFYVYKKKNNIFPTEDDILVAWYAGRPPRVVDFHTKVFLAARYYNALVQSEIKGGGQELLNFAKNKGFLQYCGERPTIFNQDKDNKRVSGRQYFVRIENWNKGDLLTKLADWLLSERSLKIDGDNAEYTLNLERIYDRGLLEELIKFYPDGNFDRISSLLVLMTTMQEAELQEVIAVNTKNRDNIFNRPLFTNGINRSSSTLSRHEMIVDGRNNDLIL